MLEENKNVMIGFVKLSSDVNRVARAGARVSYFGVGLLLVDCISNSQRVTYPKDEWSRSTL